jgi:peptidoglycan hydrolase-like protein with peptidoglycan-binding domain
MVWASGKTPPSLARPAPVTDLPVTAEQADDARDVQLLAVHGRSTELASPAVGRVTALDCVPGQAWTAGGSNLAVDGRPLVNLPSSTPMWRDIEPGAKGTDVEAIQVALTGLGFDLEPTGRFDWATRQAAAELLKRVGAKQSDAGVLEAAGVFWLPPDGAVPGECPLSLGQIVEAGVAVMATIAPLAEVRVKDLPGDLVEGARVLEADGLTVPIDAAGSVTDAEALTSLAASASYQAVAASEDRSTPWGGVLKLAEPVTVYPLAPSAIKMSGAPNGCVQASDGTGLPVKVVASQMGRSFVAFEGHEPPAKVRALPDEGLKCG